MTDWPALTNNVIIMKNLSEIVLSMGKYEISLFQCVNTLLKLHKFTAFHSDDYGLVSVGSIDRCGIYLYLLSI